VRSAASRLAIGPAAAATPLAAASISAADNPGFDAATVRGCSAGRWDTFVAGADLVAAADFALTGFAGFWLFAPARLGGTAILLFAFAALTVLPFPLLVVREAEVARFAMFVLMLVSLS
jgi:hypothetical protein